RRLEAERNFTTARQAVDRFFTRVSEDRLLNEPAMLRLRKDLLSTAREFYQRFVDERRHDPAVRAELGEAHLRLLLISQALGAVGEGVKQGEEAVRIFTALAAARPADVGYRTQLTRSWNNVGGLYREAGRWDDAEAAQKRAIALYQGLAAA